LHRIISTPKIAVDDSDRNARDVGGLRRYI
jgi:hypothetical protein